MCLRGGGSAWLRHATPTPAAWLLVLGGHWNGTSGTDFQSLTIINDPFLIGKPSITIQCEAPVR